MPKRTPVEGDPFFRITMLILSILLPVLAIILYMVVALRPVVWIIAALASAALSFLARFMDRSKGVRILVRTLYLVITALLVLMTVVLTVSMKTVMSELGIPSTDHILYLNGWVQLLLTTGLLFLLPPVACSALHTYKFDRIAMRVYAVAVWILTLFMCLIHDDDKGLLFLVQSRYASVALCLCAAFLVVCSFGYYPPQNWPFKKLYEKRRERRSRSARSLPGKSKKDQASD